ncbi:MAG TPA: ATP-binding protein [Actinomycetota bacterium]|nr:ATP-binding protein [Actinomycetota bacterium]
MHGGMTVGTGQDQERLRSPGQGALRSLAELDMLHSLAAKLNRLNDVRQIGEAITGELRTLIDYHNCRVHLLDRDGQTLVPVAFRGELTEYEGETFEGLITKVGAGMTGRVAATGESFYAPNAREVPWALQIPGTPEIDESFLAVPMRYGDRVIGVISLSKLGVDRFDREDMRVLEVLASHAAIAFENARLLQREREAAETSAALLALSQALTRVHEQEGVLAAALEEVPGIVPASAVAAYVRDPASGAFRPVAQRGFPAGRPLREVPAAVATPFLHALDRPFVLPAATVAGVPQEFVALEEIRDVLVCPLRWEPDGFGAIVIVAPSEEGFDDRALRLAGGIADITSLALGNARRFHELERFHELVETLDAVFWEADAEGLGFTFLSGRAAGILGGLGRDPVRAGARWGDHVAPDDREEAVEACRAAVREGRDASIEYRVPGPAGQTLWVRDLVHVVADAAGRARQLRGLMVDITERKRAEQALRRSERQYSRAFRREREAAQRLRALDEMKNTFLEAVSHDLRTPLTSILGSALTLEQNGRDLSSEDALDLVRRIAANARKLERLLGDLLDLDRLQRGIVAPQRRPTDLAELVRHVVEEAEVLRDRAVELDLREARAEVDPAKVERIVENLLANAVRHTPPGTRIWVATRPVPGGAELAVEDEGPGVPAELRDAVFEPFLQVPGKGNHSPGVGIGLSLVRRFAELHGGRAWVEDRPEGGASFRVFLPGQG